jgi:hypothetical protein
MRRIGEKTALFVCLLALNNPTLFAQSPRIVHTQEKSAIHELPQDSPEGLKPIYSNLKSKTDLYDDTHGWGISRQESVALPFTPKYDSHVSEVRVPVKYFAGANQVNVSIYEGSGDVPETLLAGPVTVTNLAEAGTCCTLAVASFSPFAISAGTQHWVVVGTPSSGTGSDFEGLWAAIAKIIPVAFNNLNLGWSRTSADDLPACEVLGTMP